MAVTGSVSSISSRSSFSIAMVSAVHAALTLGRWDSLRVQRQRAAALATWAPGTGPYTSPLMLWMGESSDTEWIAVSPSATRKTGACLFSALSIHADCACSRTKKRGLGRTEHAVTCGVPHQNIPRGRVLCFFEAGVEESEQKQAAGGPGRASKCSASAGRLRVSCGDFWSFSGRSVSKRV